jgi:threonine/homoserine/homoserine lactone efflux protein
MMAFLAGSAAAGLLLDHRHGIQVAASLVLVGFGAWLAARALRRSASRARALPEALLSRPFTSTYTLTVVNPLTIIAFAGFAPQLPLADSPALAAWYASCVALGSLAVQSALALGGGALGRALEHGQGLRIMNALSGAGIAAFGIAGLAGPVTA